MRKTVFVLAALGLAASAALAQGTTDFSGDWLLEMQVPLTDTEVKEVCIFEGTVTIQQDNGNVTGEAMLKLVGLHPPKGCPAEMKATIVQGGVFDSSISGVLDGGRELGTAEFSGKLSVANAQRAPGDTVAGSMTVVSGPFAGITGSGTWSALFQEIVPALPGLPLALLVVLVLGGATLLLARRRSA